MIKMLITAAVTSLCLVSGCAVVETTKLDSTTPSSGGVVYYLPTRPVKFELIRTADAITKLKFDKAKVAEKAASDTLDTANKTLKTARALRDALSSNSSAMAAAVKAVELAEADVKIAQGELKASKTNLDNTGTALLEALDGNPPLTDMITVTVLPSVADTRYRYSANLKHYATRSDTLNLKTTSAGLLSTTTAKSEEQSAQILVTLAKSIAAAGGLGPSGTGSFALAKLGNSLEKSLTAKGSTEDPASYIACGNGMQRLETDEPDPFTFEYIFDPTAETVTQAIIDCHGVVKQITLSPWKYIESSLCALGADYIFSWQSIGPEVKPKKSDKEANAEGWAGLFYRRLLPYRLDVYKGNRVFDKKTVWERESFTLLKTVHIELPNASPPELLKFTGTAFAKRDFDTEFNDGLLISHKEERPSEALSIVAIPYDIIKAAISVPADIISLKVNYSNQETTLVETQTRLLQAQKAYQDALKEKSGGGTPTQ
jgi:hypothetical protein